MIDYIKLLFYLLYPKTLFIRRISDGLGDNILLTALLPFLRQKYSDFKIVVETPWIDLFNNNPYVDWVTDKHIKTTKKHIKPKYRVINGHSSPFIQQMLNYIGVNDSGYPQLFLDDVEKEWASQNIPSRAITICPIGKTSFSANRKEWGFKNFQKLVELLPDYNFIQIGLDNDPLLHNVQDSRGLSVRQSAALIQASKLFVGLEGGFMHVARAVNIKSVIIFGGYILPEVSGYPENINISTQVDCAPCFNSELNQDNCDSMICMKDIKSEFVVSEIENYLRKL